MRYRIVFDTSILIHRNYHSLKKKTKNITANMLYNRIVESIASTLLRVSSNHKFIIGHTVMCLDSDSFRYQIYPGYKAGRNKNRSGQLSRLLPQIYEKLEEEYDCIKHDGLEADDLCYLFSEKYGNCVLISEDGDFLQMANLKNKVFVYQPFKRRLMEDSDRYFEALEKLLIGCTSDKIPKAYTGVLGVTKLKKYYEEAKHSPNVLTEVIRKIEEPGKVKIKKTQLNINRMIAVYDLSNYRNFVPNFEELWQNM